MSYLLMQQEIRFHIYTFHRCNIFDCIYYILFFLKVAPFITEDAMGRAGSMDRVNKKFVHSCD